MAAYLGDIGDDPQAVKDWRVTVKAANRVAIRMPSGQFKNELASRAMIGGDYKLAPFAVRSVDRAARLASGAFVATMAAETATENAAQGILNLPRTVAQQALGINPKVFPWLVGAAVAAYAANAFGVFRSRQ